MAIVTVLADDFQVADVGHNLKHIEKLDALLDPMHAEYIN